MRAHNLAGSARIGDEAATERTNDRSKTEVNKEEAVREIQLLHFVELNRQGMLFGLRLRLLVLRALI